MTDKQTCLKVFHSAIRNLFIPRGLFIPMV
jgi:hypothetical protein